MIIQFENILTNINKNTLILKFRPNQMNSFNFKSQIYRKIYIDIICKKFKAFIFLILLFKINKKHIKIRHS